MRRASWGRSGAWNRFYDMICLVSFIHRWWFLATLACPWRRKPGSEQLLTLSPLLAAGTRTLGLTPPGLP